MPIGEIVTQRIHKTCKQTGISLPMLAQKCNMTLRVLNWCIDRNTYDLRTLVCIADELGVDTDYLLGRTSVMTHRSCGNCDLYIAGTGCTILYNPETKQLGAEPTDIGPTEVCECYEPKRK